MNGIITPMNQIESQLDRILNLLRDKIRLRGYTQLEVQEVLGWGRSYISQLLTKQKTLRVEQVLLMLNVIGIDPASFFAELYPPKSSDLSGQPLSGDAAALRGECEGVRSQLRGLVDVLINQGIITSEELLSAADEVALPDSGE